MFEIVGGWGCGSERAPLIKFYLYYFEATGKLETWTHQIESEKMRICRGLNPGPLGFWPCIISDPPAGIGIWVIEFTTLLFYYINVYTAKYIQENIPCECEEPCQAETYEARTSIAYFPNQVIVNQLTGLLNQTEDFMRYLSARSESIFVKVMDWYFRWTIILFRLIVFPMFCFTSTSTSTCL